MNSEENTQEYMYVGKILIQLDEIDFTNTEKVCGIIKNGSMEYLIYYKIMIPWYRRRGHTCLVFSTEDHMAFSEPEQKMWVLGGVGPYNGDGIEYQDSVKVRLGRQRKGVKGAPGQRNRPHLSQLIPCTYARDS